MNTAPERLAMTEWTPDGEFVDAAVCGSSYESAFRRNAAPGNVIETRPALPGETTMSLVAEIAEQLRDPNATVRRFYLPIEIGGV